MGNTPAFPLSTGGTFVTGGSNMPAHTIAECFVHSKLAMTRHPTLGHIARAIQPKWITKLQTYKLTSRGCCGT